MEENKIIYDIYKEFMELCRKKDVSIYTEDGGSIRFDKINYSINNGISVFNWISKNSMFLMSKSYEETYNEIRKEVNKMNMEYSNNLYSLFTLFAKATLTSNHSEGKTRVDLIGVDFKDDSIIIYMNKKEYKFFFI